MFLNYVRSMEAGRPYQPMFDADPGGGGGGGTDPKDPPGDDPKDKDKDKDPKDPPNDDDVTFTEAQQKKIDEIINKTIAKERAKSEAEKKKAEERAKMTEQEKAEAERKEREQKAQEKETKANERIINLEIKDVARELGVSSKKLERFLKVVDRDDLVVDDNGDVDRTKVEKAVKAVLADMPEFKGSDDKKGPGSDFGGGGSGAKYTVAQINAMTPNEIAKDYDEVMKSLAIHNKK